MNVLHISSWYPNRNGPQEGDFIQRQLQALALYQPVHVLVVLRDDQVIGSKLEITRRELHGVVETIGYYNPGKTFDLLPGPLSSLLAYKQHFQRLVEQYIEQYGKPDLIHVHVAFKAGIIALWIKRRFNIPFVVSEHWSGYKRLDKGGIFFQPFPVRWLIRSVLNRASAIMPVSSSLGADVRLQTNNRNMTVIHNVVREDLFTPTPNVTEDAGKENPFSLLQGEANHGTASPPAPLTDQQEVAGEVPFVFIHVSTMGPEKQPQLFLRAFDAFRKDFPARLVCVGTVPPALTEWTAANIAHHTDIRFTGNVPYEQVPLLMRDAHCLLISSSYETFSCVAIEALLCGLPVISTPVGILTEIINAENGMLAQDEADFTAAMKAVYLNRRRYNGLRISRAQQGRFSYQIIGNKIVELYAAL